MAQGNSLLALIKQICIRHSSRITIPTDMRSINAAISNSRQDKLTCLEVIISYPVDLLVDENLLPVKAYYLNPRLLLAEYFITLSLGDIIIQPEFEQTTSDVPIIGHYTSAEQFKQICSQVTDIYGRDVYPLCLEVNYDSMALETTGKRSCKPLKNQPS